MSWAVTGQVFDVARVDNTLYVAGPANLGVSLGSDDTNEPFVLLDPTTAAPTQAAFDMSVPQDGTVNTVIADGADGWYVGGTFTGISNGGGGGWSGLAHLTPPGVDTAFRPAVNGIVNGLWKQGSTLYVVGFFTQVNGLPRAGGAAFDLTTGALLPWDPAIGGGAVYVVAVSGGTAFLGGIFTTASGTSRPGFAAVDATTGALATSPTTTLNTGAIVNAMQLSGNTLYLSGLFTAIGADSRANVGAIDITSGATLAFSADTNGQVGSLLLDGAGLYMGGAFQTVGGQPRARLARVDAATGAVDSWSADASGAVTALLRIGTTLYATGGFSRIGGAPRLGAAALSTTTGVPLPWNPGVAGGFTNVLRSSTAGDILIAGAFTHLGAVPRPGVAAIDIVTNEPLPFSITVDGVVRGITAVGNALYLSGTFQTVNGESRPNFAAVDRRTGALLPWNPNASGAIGNILGGRSVAVQGSTAYLGGHFTSVGGQPRFGLALVDATTGAVLPFTADTGGGGVNKVVLSGQTMYVGGNFSMIGGQVRQGLAAFDLTSGTPALTPLSVTLTSGLTPAINTMKVVGSTLYLGGLFLSVNGQTRLRAAALTVPGGAVTAFNPGINAQVFDIDVLGDTAYLAGAFSQVNGAFRPAFAAVDAATGQVNRPFAPDSPTGIGSRVMAAPEGLVAAGNIFAAWLQFFPTTGLAGLPGPPTAPIAGQVPAQGLFLFWGPPAVGGDVTGYRLEVGSVPGAANIATIPIAGSDPFFLYQGIVPPGTYYTRVRAVSAAGIGPASPESAFTSGAGFCLGPFPSTFPTATVNGGNVTIAWADPAMSAPMTYALSAGTVSGQANIGTFPVGAAMQFSANAPPGAYFVRVHGQNACGIPSPSPELLVSVGGVFPLDAPAVTAELSGGVVTVSWTPVAGAAGYVLEAGFGPLDARIVRVPVAGTSLSATPPAGTYYVRVYAVGGPTGVSHASNETVIVLP
ncbi:MAG: hypothetical protein AB7Q16_15415 [Vicinamibacterales bacterium]